MLYLIYGLDINSFSGIRIILYMDAFSVRGESNISKVFLAEFQEAQRNKSHGPPNAAVFQVEGNYTYPFAKSAADLKRTINLFTTNQLEPLGNLAFLKEDTNRAVYRYPCGLVHQHRFFSRWLDRKLLYFAKQLHR